MSDNLLHSDIGEQELSDISSYFDNQREAERLASERAAAEREALNAERKTNAQRLLATQTGNKLGKLLSIINPELSVLGNVMGTVVETAGSLYHALDDASTQLAKVSASMKILGIDAEELNGAVQMHQDIETLKARWRSFWEELETDITGLYGDLKGYVEKDAEEIADNTKNLTDEQIAQKAIKDSLSMLNPAQQLINVGKDLLNGESIGQALFSNSAVSELFEHEKVLADRAKEREVIESEFNTEIEKILNESVDNLGLTTNELVSKLTSMTNTFTSSGMDYDTSVGITNNVHELATKLFNDGTTTSYEEGFDAIQAAIAGKYDKLNALGFGLNETGFIGYKNSVNSAWGAGTVLRDDMTASLQLGYIDTIINGEKGLAEALYDNGYELKQNTQSLQKWQWIESVGNYDDTKPNLTTGNYKIESSVLDEILNETEGIAQNENTSVKSLEEIVRAGNNLGKTLDDVVRENMSKAVSLDTFIKNNGGYDQLEDFDSHMERIKPYINQGGQTLDDLLASQGYSLPKAPEGSGLDELLSKINIEVTASSDLDIKVQRQIQEGVYSAMNSMTPSNNNRPVSLSSLLK